MSTVAPTRPSIPPHSFRTDERPHAVVIGAGLAGLASAARLAAAGMRVTMFDPNPHAGGKMNVWEQSGYRFDMGPTILTMPSVLRRLFQDCGRNAADYLNLVRLDPQWRCLFADGSVIDLWEQAERMRQEITQKAPGDLAGYDRFLQTAHQMLALSNQYFFWKPYGGLKDLLKEYGAFSLTGLKLGVQLQPLTSLHDVVSRAFRDPRMVQIFDHFIQYVGSSPFLSPAILSLIAAVQFEEGITYPMGGMCQVARSVRRLGEEHGVELRSGAVVEEILLNGTRASGVRLTTGEEIQADVVVSNCDVIRTHRELLKHRYADDFLRREKARLEPACSGVVLYLGCRRTWDHLAHHDFVFSQDPDQEFHDIYDLGMPANDMTAYLAIPSLTDDSVAPVGCSALYVLVHTPYRTDRFDWARDGRGYRDQIVSRLESRGLDGLSESIEVEHHLFPTDIERLYRSQQGSIYGLLTRKGLTAAFKPGNRSELFSGLYFAGGSANPGAGVPMVLMSGQIAADCVLADLGATASLANR